jgi:peptide/nickel transport system substrate-binding protein
VFDKWTPGNEARVIANKAYFDGSPSVNEVIFKVIKDETAAAIAVENREIDIFYALQQPDMIARMRKAKGVVVFERPANHTINLVLNTTIKPLDDVRVRRAMTHAINRKALIDGYFKGTKNESGTSTVHQKRVGYVMTEPERLELGGIQSGSPCQGSGSAFHLEKESESQVWP